jgi:hypothetical protein
LARLDDVEARTMIFKGGNIMTVTILEALMHKAVAGEDVVIILENREFEIEI